MKQHKRYHSEEEIIAEMESVKSKSSDLCKEADQIDAGRHHWDEFGRDAAELKRRKAFLLQTNKLEELKHKLAEFRTPLLPALDNGDRSVNA